MQSNLPLFPRMKQSPSRFFNSPFWYSSVCSSAMFMKPSKQVKIPVEVVYKYYNTKNKINNKLLEPL